MDPIPQKWNEPGTYCRDPKPAKRTTITAYYRKYELAIPLGLFGASRITFELLVVMLWSIIRRNGGGC